MKKLTAVVAGFGMRGKTYSYFFQKLSENTEIVAIAEPIDIRREAAKEHRKLPDSKMYTDWREIAAQPKMADFAVICTQDITRRPLHLLTRDTIFLSKSRWRLPQKNARKLLKLQRRRA